MKINGLSDKATDRICDTCVYDYFCMKVNRPMKSCVRYLKVEEGKTSEDYAK